MTRVTTFNCPKCSAPLDAEPGKTTLRCQFCGSSVVIPEALRIPADEPEPPQFQSAAPQIVISTSSPAYGPYTPSRTVSGRGCIATLVGVIVACVGVAGALVFAIPMGDLVNTLESGLGVDLDGSGSIAVSEGGGDSVAITDLGSLPGLAGVTSGYAKEVLRFGSAGVGQGQFEDARHVGVDNQGNIYVAEYLGTGRIQVFDAQGSFLAMWMVEDDDIPLTGMAVAPDGTVYIAYNGEITMHNGMTGELLGRVPGKEHSWYSQIILGADGSIVTWGWTDDNIIRMDTQGFQSLLIPDAINAITDESMMSISALAVDGVGNIYAVADWEPAVFIFNKEGAFQNRFGSEGDEPGQFVAPSGIAVDGQQRIYVLDFFGIKVFRSDGQYLDTIATTGPTYGITIQGNALYLAAMDHVVKYELPAE